MQIARAPRRCLAAMLVTVALLAPSIASAQACDPNTEARLDFLETRLEDGQPRAKLWWGSWMAIFTIGVVAGVTQGTLHDDNGAQVNNFITAGKAVLGMADLTFRPHVARYGADRVRAIPKSSSANCTERLHLAEKTMETAAKEANMRWDWKRHVWSLTLNLAHGLVIAEAFKHDQSDGWTSFAVSEVSSEAFLWTHPTRAANDWNDYHQQFDGTRLSKLGEWHFAPHPGGIAIAYNF
ncbi:MAG TPA: hypothetical protein VN634_22315 [Candidatus Limnocylindrales bacterium]|nr:hypothetical protein [Candidatus Limnocylindrales bacterium]